MFPCHIHIILAMPSLGEKSMSGWFRSKKNLITKLAFFSVVSQSIFVFMPGRQPLQFYLCSNQLSEEIDALPHKVNWPSTLVLITSVVLHLIFSCRIKRFKAKQQRSVQPLQQQQLHPNQTRLDDLSYLEKQSVSDVVTNLLTIVGATVLFGSLAVTNWPKPSFFTQVVSYVLNSSWYRASLD